jgi:hypothetical protein
MSQQKGGVMRAFGVTYDTGFPNGGTTSREPFDPAVVVREMQIIRDELRCDAVRVTGGDLDRLETAARHGATAGLEVWYCPFTNGLTQDELLGFLADSAKRAEELRRSGAQVAFLTGSEISLFTDGFLPGSTVGERLADPQRMRAALPGLPGRVNAFLGQAAAAARAAFGGRVGYASLPFEGVDWAHFDIVATDAVYPNARTAGQLGDGLRALAAHGKPAAVTEFGCPAYRGAGASGEGDTVIEWDDHARPVRFARAVARDEREQADYLRTVLRQLEGSAIDAAFVNTFARYDLPHADADERDFDRASYGIVKVLGEGQSGTAYPGMPWEPKEAFHALAEYGRAQADGPRQPG